MHMQFWNKMFQVYYLHIKMQQCGVGRWFRSVLTGGGGFCPPGVTVALGYKDICFLFNLDSREKWKKLQNT